MVPCTWTKKIRNFFSGTYLRWKSAIGFSEISLASLATASSIRTRALGCSWWDWTLAVRLPLLITRLPSQPPGIFFFWCCIHDGRASSRVARILGDSGLQLAADLVDSKGKVHKLVGDSIVDLVKKGREANILLVSPARAPIPSTPYTSPQYKDSNWGCGAFY